MNSLVLKETGDGVWRISPIPRIYNAFLQWDTSAERGALWCWALVGKGALWGCCPGFMIFSSSTKSHLHQESEGSARAPCLPHPGVKSLEGGSLPSLVPHQGTTGLAAVPLWGAAKDPDLRRRRTFPFSPLMYAGQLVAFSLPPFVFLFLPFRGRGGGGGRGCAPLRQKPASDAKTKVERTPCPALPSRPWWAWGNRPSYPNTGQSSDAGSLWQEDMYVGKEALPPRGIPVEDGRR